MIVLQPQDAVQRLVDGYEFLEAGRQCLTCVINPKGYHGYGVGVCDRNVKGYTGTNYVFESVKYTEAQEMVLEANRQLFPDLETIEILQIELSTHGR